jgi:hypothetical protein
MITSSHTWLVTASFLMPALILGALHPILIRHGSRRSQHPSPEKLTADE